MDHERLATPADALGAVDRIQRGVRDQLVLAMPRIPWARGVLFPTFLLLLGSEAARGQRGEGTNDLLLGLYLVLAIWALLAERLAEQRRGLMIARRRFPRAGKRQMLGVWVVLGGIVATNVLGAVTDLWWIGLPVGLLVAAATLRGRARWVASFDRVGRADRGRGGSIAGPGAGFGSAAGSESSAGSGFGAAGGATVGESLAGLGAAPGARLPGNLPAGPFETLAALRLGALLALADRAQPERLEIAMDLPPGALTEAADALARDGLVRRLEPSEHGPILAFTRRGRRAFRTYLAELTRR